MSSNSISEAFSAIEVVFQLYTAYEGLVLSAALCSIRIMAALTVLPATNDAIVKGMIRGGLSALLGIWVAFGVPHVDVLALGAAAVLGLALKELLIGLLVGFSASIVFWIAESVGALIDNQAGYNNVQLVNPMSGIESTPVADLLLQFAIILFYLLGGMLVFLGLLIETFKVWPVLSAFPSMDGALDVFVIQQHDLLMSATVKLAAPVLLVLMLIDVGLGLVTRMSEKIEPGNLAQPIKGAVAMLLLALFIGAFTAQVRAFLIPSLIVDQLQQALPHKVVDPHINLTPSD